MLHVIRVSPLWQGPQGRRGAQGSPRAAAMRKALLMALGTAALVYQVVPGAPVGNSSVV